MESNSKSALDNYSLHIVTEVSGTLLYVFLSNFTLAVFLLGFSMFWYALLLATLIALCFVAVLYLNKLNWSNTGIIGYPFVVILKGKQDELSEEDDVSID